MELNNASLDLSNNSFLIINIVGLLEKAIINMDVKGEFSINDQEISFIKQIMVETPETFHDVSLQLNNILNNKRIAISDIPEIIYIISTIYISKFNYKNINIIDCIQFTLDTLIDSGILHVDNNTEEVLKSIVHFSLKLLKTTIPIIEEKVEIASVSCFNRFKQCITSSCCK
jgi:hypothetical protein